MKKLSTSICLGLGDNLVARIVFDTVKHQYDEIRISHNKDVMFTYKNGDLAYQKFLQEIGRLLFTEPPYYFDNRSYTPIHTLNPIKNLYIPSKPNIQHLMCRGELLNLEEEYIVITTKIRGIEKKKFFSLSSQLWQTLNKLSNKYRIVVMGERVVEQNLEQKANHNVIYGIYDQIISNLPANRILDLTVPALGIMAPDLSKIQQDGLIMNLAKFVITFGIGGNVWLAVATSDNVIGFRDIDDCDSSSDIIFSPNFISMKMTKDWAEFIRRLEQL